MTSVPQPSSAGHLKPLRALALDSKLRRPDWVAALGITMIAVWLHLSFLFHAGGLWRDEVNVVNLAARSSFGEMTKDSFPVLMPLAVRVWGGLGFGQGDLGLRLLGVAIGLSLLAGLWLSARATVQSPPLAGLSLFALNSIVITYGDSLRAYGLGSLLIVMAAVAMWRYLQQPVARRAAVAAGFALLSVHTLYQNSVLVAAICFGAWAVCWRRKAGRAALHVLLIATLSAASLLPYLANLLSAKQSAAVLRSGFPLERAFANLVQAIGFPLQSYLYVWGLLALVVIVGGFASWRPRVGVSSEGGPTGAAGEVRLFAGVVLVCAVAGFGAFLWLAALPTQPWYFLPLMAIAAICFDAGSPSLLRAVRVPLFGLVVATACITIPYAGQDMNRRFTNVDLLARRLATEASPNDFVVVAQWYCGITFERYFTGSTPWSTLPPLADHRTHRYDLLRSALQTSDPLRPVLDQMAGTLQGGHRVWIVGRMHIPLPGTPPPASLPPAPLPSSGWSDKPYMRIWPAEVAHFLNEHSRQFERVDVPPGGWINPNEDMELFTASGWKAGP